MFKRFVIIFKVIFMIYTFYITITLGQGRACLRLLIFPLIYILVRETSIHNSKNKTLTILNKGQARSILKPPVLFLYKGNTFLTIINPNNQLTENYRMSKQQLRQLLIKGETAYQREGETWFKRYNDVIEAYNLSSPNTSKLQKMYCPSKSNLIMNYLINNYLLNIAIVLFLTFVPLLNIVLEIYIISYMFFLKRQTKKHQENLAIVQDPLEGFFYYPQMCAQLQKHFTILNLLVEEIENFRFNDKIRLNLLKDIDGAQDKSKKHSVKVPIYDQYFYDSFFLVRKQYFKLISWSALGIFLLPLCVLFYVAIYEDFIES